MEQIERFIWSTAKSKLEIKLPLKVFDDPLLLCTEFNSGGERYYFGETKAIQKIIEASNCLSKYGEYLRFPSGGRSAAYWWTATIL